MRTRRLIGVLAATALAATACLGENGDEDPNRGANATQFSLAISANAIAGGKSAQEAQWFTDYVIPEFTKRMKDKGITAKIEFQPAGVADERYKTQLALDLKTGGGADIIAPDATWIGEFAQAGYLKPLTEVIGGQVDEWDGWDQIPETIQANMSFEGKRYGVPVGTDGRVLFYNRKLFAQAGLPADWQPTSWQQIIDAGEALKRLPGVIPIQLNASPSMGEATTMQGILPLLVGTGAQIYDRQSGTWQGATENVKDVLTFYQRVYGGGLADRKLQEEPRENTFLLFAQNRIGILVEGDFFWRSAINPDPRLKSPSAMPDRDQAVGYALIPARQPGQGIRGQDVVSMSGGGGYAINPNTPFPQQAWELLRFMASAEAVQAFIGDTPRITARDDVNAKVLGGDPMLTFVAEKVLPVTATRPGLAAYPEVSQALREATGKVINGTSPERAAQEYQEALENALGGSDDIDTGG